MRFHLVPSLLLVLSCWFSSAFVPPSDSPRPPSSSLSARLGPTRYHLDASSRRCAYRVAPPAPGFESAPSLLLIHPIGIGCASWFWDPFVRAWSGNRLLVPDLIGCGASDRFDPRESGMFVPLDWTRQLEDLCREESKGRGQVVAVSQGGMAPVALSLATRQSDRWNGPRSVSRVIAATPPGYAELAGGLPAAEVRTNFARLSSPPGRLLYPLLRLRGFVRLFSDLFLFRGGCPEEWLERCEEESHREGSEWPVFAFNSGFVVGKGYQEELDDLARPLLIVHGGGDRLVERRRQYQRPENGGATLELVEEGNNVIPYENAEDFAAIVKKWLNVVFVDYTD